MKLLELFSGTGSIGKVAEKMGYEVVSLDLHLPATINIDIMKWDYRAAYQPGHFDLITASPICAYWSCLKYSSIGKNIKGTNKKYSMQSIQEDIDKFGKPMVDRVREILDYFRPKYYWIENPKSSSMKKYITDLPFYDVDYCRYSDFGYRKRTRFWTNIKDFKPLLCNRKCGNMVGNRHVKGAGAHSYLEDGTLINSKKKREDAAKKGLEYKTVKKKNTTRLERYRIPPELIKELLNIIIL
tara:strand:+ start:711 stop:1433 length:723 start_codon:yes stop_codon:yes gene_type:complete